MIKEQTAWAVTRYSVDGYAYIDIESISSCREYALQRAQKANKECGPTWAKDNVIGQPIEIAITKRVH